MSATALFGNTSGLGGSSGGNKHLVEFRAGRMTLKGRMVHPDKRKGLLYVYQGEDSLMHFCWKDRTTGEVEDDLLIFPDDCEFVRVNECTTGRVYVLKFKSFSKKYFFWMQEPKTDKDDDFCRRINEALNNPPTSGGRGSSGSGAQDGELQNLLNNMSQQQLMQLFGGVNQIGGLSSLLGTMGNSGNGGSGRTSGSASRSGSAPRTEPRSETRAATRPRDPAPATTAAATPAAAAAAPTTTTASATPRAGTGTGSGQGQIFLSDLQRYFSGLAPPGLGGAEEAGVERELPAALAGADVVGTAAAPPHAERLAPHLPPAPDNAAQDDVRTTLLSPQFAQAAALFSSALTSGQMGPIISQFGLNQEVASAASSGDVQAFFKALENSSNSETDASKDSKDSKGDKKEPKKDDKKDDDAGMSLD
ncbi:proteasomal ubiquitin receptor ADRM1 isoform X1 [Plutella xylostella]|uniref:proteasomal ubiquitin receptor ADRM1 isoform X1 n=1 Tax=Plutella xylostella TaxID=51655 RepID=UPI0020327FAD|nr:proteasomal ubiquitin receptor ADRM1 isoform X1 [Plutella xylostella]